MPIQPLVVMISTLALLVAIGSFLSSRQAAWSIRYYERWFQLAKLVLDHADALLPLWCSRLQYQALYQGTLPPDREPQAIELVFTEIYVDFLIEVHRRSGLSAFLTGRFPGRVPLTNPRALHIWNSYLRLMFSAHEQRVVDRVIAQGASSS
jgi:hypothetical protein